MRGLVWFLCKEWQMLSRADRARLAHWAIMITPSSERFLKKLLAECNQAERSQKKKRLDSRAWRRHGETRQRFSKKNSLSFRQKCSPGSERSDLSRTNSALL